MVLPLTFVKLTSSLEFVISEYLMNQIHLKIINFFMNGDSKWLHIEKFSCRRDKAFQNFTEKYFQY